MIVHRMNLVIEVPAIPEFEKASLVSFPDMLNLITGLVERTKHDAEGRIANAVYKYSTEWGVKPELDNVVKEVPEV